MEAKGPSISTFNFSKSLRYYQFEKKVFANFRADPADSAHGLRMDNSA